MKAIFSLIVLLSTIKPIHVYIQKGSIYLYLKNEIRFDNNDSLLQSNNKVTLNKIAIQLLERPTLQIEIASHTDIDAKKEDALDFTTKRANNIKKYLIGRGVNPNRLIAKGYGFDKPLVKCKDYFNCTATEKRQNRRVCFKVILGDLGKHKIIKQ